MKFFLLEAVLITIALACLVEGGYLAWLSATASDSGTFVENKGGVLGCFGAVPVSRRPRYWTAVRIPQAARRNRLIQRAASKRKGTQASE
jgi:hypothetical protein